jgi:hypothetical protein
MMRISAAESGYREILSPDELLIYASAGSTEPLRLSPVQLLRLQLLIDDLAAEATGTGSAWRVNRTEYRAKAG